MGNLRSQNIVMNVFESSNCEFKISKLVEYSKGPTKGPGKIHVDFQVLEFPSICQNDPVSRRCEGSPFVSDFSCY